MGGHLLNPYSLVLFLTAAGTAVLALSAARFRDKRAARGLIGVLVGGAIWAFADAVRIGAGSTAAVLFWNKVSYVGVVVIPPSLVVFVAAYTDRERWLRPAVIGGLLAVSAAALVTVFTNQWHGLWRSSEVVMPGTAPPVIVEQLGALHLLWIAYVLFLIVPVTFGALVSELRRKRQSRLLRRQVLILLGGMAIPTVTAALFAVRAFTVDLTPLGFGAMGTAFTVAMTRYRLLDIVPIARDIVLEQMESGVLVIDGDDQIVDANERAAELLDGASGALVGQSIHDVVEGLATDVGHLADAPKADETVAVTGDEQTEYYDVRISPIRTSGGVQVGRVVLFSDITDRVCRQERLEAQKRELQRQNERLDEFAGIVSHDLRNPLQVIEANLELIEEPEDDQHLRRIADATDRMTELVDQVLTLARTGEGLQETEDVDLRSVVERAWTTVETDGASLNCSVSGTVRADRSQLRQLFENLFRNAVEHAGPGVAVTVGDTDGGFYVADDGPGLPARMRRDDGSLALADESGGYGLRIVESVVSAHGWQLRVGSAPDGGARFEILTEE